MTFDYEDLYDESRQNEIDVDATIQDLILQREQSLASKDKKEQNHTSLIGGGDSNCDGDTVAPENSEAQTDTFDAQENTATTDNSSEVHDSSNSLEPEKAEQNNAPSELEKDGTGFPTPQDGGRKQEIRSSTEHSRNIPKDGKIIFSLESKISFPKPAKSEEDKINEIKSLKDSLSQFETYEDLLEYAKEYVAKGYHIDSELFFLFHTVYTLPQPWKYFTFFRDSLFSYNSITEGKRKNIERFVAGIANKK